MEAILRDRIMAIMCDAGLYAPERHAMTMLLDAAEIKAFGAGESIIPEGRVCTNLYMMVEGIFRNGYRDIDREVTHGFGRGGSFFFSPRGFLAGRKSVYFFEAVVDSMVLLWPKSVVEEMIRRSHDLSQWLLHVCMNQFLILEDKASFMGGSAKERYEALFNKEWNNSLTDAGFHRRTEIINMVSSKILASYLDVSPSYLSYLKNPKGYDKSTARRTSSRESRKETVLNLIGSDSGITVSRLAKSTGFGLRSVKAYIAELQREGKLRRDGSARSGRWVVVV